MASFVKTYQAIQKNPVCRPDRLTCRWIIEMSEAITNVCHDPELLRVLECRGNPDSVWTTFYSSLRNSSCIRHPIVRDIIEYRADYNDYRNHEK